MFNNTIPWFNTGEFLPDPICIFGGKPQKTNLNMVMRTNGIALFFRRRRAAAHKYPLVEENISEYTCGVSDFL
ncbi:hypothetical protein JQK62_02925 [Leptospira santarosai]|nr:hypothetical protein [Leptospira santarosai]